MVFRVYVEKKPGFDVEAQQLAGELRTILGLTGLKALRIVNRVREGSIILCHNNGLHTAEALPVVLDTLKNKGYTFVTVGELIVRENYTIDANGRQHAAA